MSAGRNGVKHPNGMRQDLSVVHFMFLLTRLIRCCKAAPSCMKTVAPDFWDSVNPYNRHFFKPALQVAQRALCFQATLAVAVFASYHFTVQKQLWWERLLVLKKKKRLLWYAGYQNIMTFLRLFPAACFQTGTEKKGCFLSAVPRHFGFSCTISKIKFRQNVRSSSWKSR